MPASPALAVGVNGAEPIDFAHLRSQTMGDAVLERELLTLFAAQARAILADLAHPPALPTAGRLDAAGLLHTLSGSARAVGAWDVAAGAERLERAARRGPLDRDLAPLGRSVADACALIDRQRQGEPPPRDP